MKTHAERVNFLSGIAELLRNHFNRGEYQDVDPAADQTATRSSWVRRYRK